MARPSFKPTVVSRRMVANAAGGGMAHDEIAMALGISRGTLLKYFPKELTEGACKKRLEVLDAMHRTAKKGNVAAQRAYLATAAPRGVAPVPDAPRTPPKGKKAQAQEAAGVAQEGTDWAELLPGSKAIQ